jgi:hypothetical protein
MGGGYFLKLYGDSLYAALRDLYPEQEWHEHRCRPRVSPAYWDSLENHKALLKEVERQHGIKEAGDWKKVTVKDLEKAGAGAMLRRYSSVDQMLKTVLGSEEYAWDAMQCRPMLPNRYWNQQTNLLAFMEAVKEHWDIRSKDDWYRISTNQLREIPGGNTLVQKMPLVDMLRSAYPGEHWDERDALDLGRGKKSSQRKLCIVLQNLFELEASSRVRTISATS